VAVPNPASAVSLLAELRKYCGDLVSSFELVPDIAIKLVTEHLPSARSPLDTESPWYVLCEITSALSNEPLAERLEAALAAALETGLITDASLAQSERERQDFWFVREQIPEAQRRDGPSIKHDISLPLDRLAEFIAGTSDWLHDQVPEGFLVCYGHVGDGNLHFNINQSTKTAAAGALLARQDEIRRTIHDRVHELGGSFSAEHGIGRHKVEELERYATPLELELMRHIKRAFDPNGIMNPGKVLRSGSVSR
jgi:FAD/FMN-containing dehydrogenase